MRLDRTLHRPRLVAVSSPQGSRRTSLIVRVSAVAVFLVVLMVLLGLATRDKGQGRVEIAAARPVWTATLTGTTGDIAAVWIWTRNATLRTNLRVPAELRSDQKTLLVQVRSEGNLALAMDVTSTNLHSAHVRIVAGTSNSAEFISSYPFRLLELGGFSAANLPSSVPFGLTPVYERPWSAWPVRYDAVTHLPAGR